MYFESEPSYLTIELFSINILFETEKQITLIPEKITERN